MKKTNIWWNHGVYRSQKGPWHTIPVQSCTIIRSNQGSMDGYDIDLFDLVHGKIYRKPWPEVTTMNSARFPLNMFPSCLAELPSKHVEIQWAFLRFPTGPLAPFHWDHGATAWLRWLRGPLGPSGTAGCSQNSQSFWNQSWHVSMLDGPPILEVGMRLGDGAVCGLIWFNMA